MSSQRYAHNEREQHLERDAMHHATLRLASGKLPEGYLNDAFREQLHAYHADDEARERLADRSEAWMKEAALEAGNLAEAKRCYEGNAEDGMQFALLRGLRTHGDIQAYRIGNPTFRGRYDEDLAFQHGVEAGAWANRE